MAQKKSKTMLAAEARRRMGNLHLESEDALTAGTLIDGARMYAASADAVNARLPLNLFPLSHLLCTSIELALKALLRHHGSSEDDLRKLGHNLPKLFERAVVQGLRHTGGRAQVMALAGKPHEERLFIYPEAGIGRTITPGRLRAMCHELIVEVFAVVKGAEEAAALSKEPGLCIESNYLETLPVLFQGGWTGREKPHRRK